MRQHEVLVMRLWHETNSQEAKDAWRVTITDTKNQEKVSFANLEALCGFLKERLERETR